MKRNFFSLSVERTPYQRRYFYIRARTALGTECCECPVARPSPNSRTDPPDFDMSFEKFCCFRPDTNHIRAKAGPAKELIFTPDGGARKRRRKVAEEGPRGPNLSLSPWRVAQPFPKICGFEWPILPGSGLWEGWGFAAPAAIFSAIRIPRSLSICFTPKQFSLVPLTKLLTSWYSCDTRVRVVRSP
jgi:hypothetical protein